MYTFEQSLRILALDAIVRPDAEARYRRICRWYSRNFHVPLLEVHELDVVHVLQEYYEAEYEDMEADDLAKAAQFVCETEEARQKRIVADKKKLRNDTLDVMASMERMRKSIEKAKAGIVDATDSFGKKKAPIKTAMDLKASDGLDSLAANVADILKNAAPAPKPRAPVDFGESGGIPDFKWETGGQLPDDELDALGNLPGKKP